MSYGLHTLPQLIAKALESPTFARNCYINYRNTYSSMNYTPRFRYMWIVSKTAGVCVSGFVPKAICAAE